MSTALRLIQDLERGSHFSYTRWCDAEWIHVMEAPHAPAVDHEYFPDLGLRLRNILRSKPNYLIGTYEPLTAKKHFDYSAVKWMLDGLQTIRSDSMYRLIIKSDQEKVEFPLITALRERKSFQTLILVGPRHIVPVFERFECGGKKTLYIQIPSHNCWSEYTKVLNELLRSLESRGVLPAVVCFSAGGLANVLIDDLYREYEGKVWFLDLGSIWDPYVGISTRSWCANLKHLKDS